MSLKYKIIIIVVSLGTAFAFGRYTVPEKIKVITKTVEVEKKSTDKDTKKSTHKHKQVVIVDTSKPDGTHQKTTTITEDDSNILNNNIKQSDNLAKTDDKSSETKKETDHLVVLGMLGVDVTKPTQPVYGLSASKPLIGPVTMGLFGLSSGVGGIELGLTF